MKTLLIIIAIVFIGALAFTLGVGYGSAQKPAPITQESVSYSRIDMYNVYMLKNCLIELQAIKGGE